MRRDGLERRVAAADDFGVCASAAFEGVFDEPGNVLFVFDDEHSVLLHVAEATVVGSGFASVSKLLNLGYRSRVLHVILPKSWPCS